MWEISNEVTLAADIGDANRVYNGERMPSLKDVAGFFDAADNANVVRIAEFQRLVQSGIELFALLGIGIRLRTCRTPWQRENADSFECGGSVAPGQQRRVEYEGKPMASVPGTGLEKGYF